MKIEAKRLTHLDLDAALYISEHLIDSSEIKPTPAHLSRLLNDSRTYVFAAMCDEQIIGYAIAYAFPSLYASTSLAYLYDIEIMPSHRKMGAGRALMEALRKQLQSDGISEIWLGTATDNAAGQALFHATGGVKSNETFNEFAYDL